MTARPGMERVYRALLQLYPPEFRQRFGDDMVQLFHDRLRDARAGRVRGGVAGAWLKLLVDVAATAPSEHLRRTRQVAHSMSSARLIEARLLGILGVIGGGALLTAFVLDVPSGLTALRIAVFNVGIIAVVIAVLRGGAVRPSVPVLVAGLAAIAANSLYAVMVMADIHPGAFPLWTGVALWLTTALFGVVALRRDGLTRWGALAVAVGGVLAVTGIDRLGLVSAASPTIFDPLSQAGIGLVGIGLIVMGLDAVSHRPASRAAH